MNYITKCGVLLHAKNVFSPPVKFSGINAKLIVTPPNHLQVALNQNTVNKGIKSMCVCVYMHNYLHLTQSWMGHPASLLSKAAVGIALSCLSTAANVRAILFKNIFFWINMVDATFLGALLENINKLSMGTRQLQSSASLWYLWFMTGISFISLAIMEKSAEFYIM